MLRADLHVHTYYSQDSILSLEKIIECCLRKGISCIAVTDHNSISGALEMQRIAPFTVIVGEEIETTSGEITGLFLTEEIPPYLSAQTTVERIKAQHGLVCVPHPFDRLRRSPLRREALQSIVSLIDIVEVFNARTMLPRDNTQARMFAQGHAIPASAGSDAHTAPEIGGAYVCMPEFSGAEDFKSALAQGEVKGQRASLRVHLATFLVKCRRRLAPVK